MSDGRVNDMADLSGKVYLQKLRRKTVYIRFPEYLDQRENVIYHFPYEASVAGERCVFWTGALNHTACFMIRQQTEIRIEMQDNQVVIFLKKVIVPGKGYDVIYKDGEWSVDPMV